MAISKPIPSLESHAEEIKSNQNSDCLDKLESCGATKEFSSNNNINLSTQMTTPQTANKKWMGSTQKVRIHIQDQQQHSSTNQHTTLNYPRFDASEQNFFSQGSTADMHHQINTTTSRLGEREHLGVQSSRGGEPERTNLSSQNSLDYS